jgi:hypothetical protein
MNVYDDIIEIERRNYRSGDEYAKPWNLGGGKRAV